MPSEINCPKKRPAVVLAEKRTRESCGMVLPKKRRAMTADVLAKKKYPLVSMRAMEVTIQHQRLLRVPMRITLTTVSILILILRTHCLRLERVASPKVSVTKSQWTFVRCAWKIYALVMGEKVWNKILYNMFVMKRAPTNAG